MNHRPKNIDAMFSRAHSMPALMRRNPRAEDRGSIFSRDIFLNDRSEGASSVFAKEVVLNGWSSVGDAKRGGYIGAYIHI